jgi:hypothetical protein
MAEPQSSLPQPADLPSSRKLLRSTLIALTAAAVLLITAVLPAEYGVDPTGIGGVLGLTEMGALKLQLAREARAAARAGSGPRPAAAAPAPAAPAPAARPPDGKARTAEPQPAAPAPAVRSDVTQVTLAPKAGREFKLSMRAGARVKYTWSSDRGEVSYDKHADSTNPPRKYHGYRKGSAASDEGVLVAAFEGWHGWFWRNRTTEPLTVTLRTEGDYRDLKEIKE